MSKLEYSFDISDYLVTFVRVAITGVSENVSIPGDFDWEDLYILSERHKLSATVWRGIQSVGLKVPKYLYENWYVGTQQVLSKSGGGLRFYADLYVLQERLVFSDDEQRYLTEALLNLDPQRRVQNLYDTVNCLYRGTGELSPQTKELIFSSGTYGGHTQCIYNSMPE